MNNIVIEFSQEEIDSTYLALTHAMIGNTNQESVKDFMRIRNKMDHVVSKSMKETVEFLKIIQGGE